MPLSDIFIYIYIYTYIYTNGKRAQALTNYGYGCEGRRGGGMREGGGGRKEARRSQGGGGGSKSMPNRREVLNKCKEYAKSIAGAERT